ncbi:CorA family divalent cation transporter [Sphingosinicellaceae bacterium]|nr:CorA family divalent cation transporter [Sphingosinicellaceae bacterium]
MRAYLYDAEGRDREVDADAATVADTGDHQLLWFDLKRDDSAGLRAVSDLLSLAPEVRAALAAPGDTFRLSNYEGHFDFSVPAPPVDDRRSDGRLDFVVAETWLVTVRDHEIQFLVDFRDQDRGESLKGALTPAVLAASLLDWHLESYYDAITEVGKALDELDGKVLASKTSASILESLAAMRHRVALLRVAVADQRPLFHGLVRPDFAPIANDAEALGSYQALAARYDRVVDSVDRARDAVVGSFDLFASKTGQETNDLVKVLTFLTVIIGIASAIAGLFGMNFDVPFEKTGAAGFYSVVIALALLVILAAVVARRRRWI